MTPIRKWIRNRLERMLGRYYEGPEPPKRAEVHVAAFRALHPDATPAQWEEFAIELARGAYREGYVRGYEWTERDLDSKPKDDPDVLAEQMRHEWAPAPMDVTVLRRGDAARRPIAPSDEHFARLFDAQGRAAGAWRIDPGTVDSDE